MNSALRCEGLRLSLFRVFWWRIGRRSLRGGALRRPQLQATRAQRLDDLLDRLATEVRDRVQLRLGLLQQVADGLDAGTLEAVVRADAELELLDQDVVHPVRAAGRRGTHA